MSTYGGSRPTRRGSFGLVVRDLAPQADDEDDLLVLTAAHLFDGAPDRARVLCAPPGPEPSSATGTHCGELRRRVPLHHLPFISVDAAVVKPRPGFVRPDRIMRRAPRDIHDLWSIDQQEPVAVRKHGAQTGITSGELLPIPADHYMVDVRARYTCGWWVEGKGNNPFASKGDSGAIVVDEANRAVGMVVAIERDGDCPAAYIHGIKQILTALEIELLHLPGSRQ